MFQASRFPQLTAQLTGHSLVTTPEVDPLLASLINVDGRLTREKLSFYLMDPRLETSADERLTILETMIRDGIGEQLTPPLFHTDAKAYIANRRAQGASTTLPPKRDFANLTTQLQKLSALARPDGFVERENIYGDIVDLAATVLESLPANRSGLDHLYRIARALPRIPTYKVDLCDSLQLTWGTYLNALCGAHEFTQIANTITIADTITLYLQDPENERFQDPDRSASRQKLHDAFEKSRALTDPKGSFGNVNARELRSPEGRDFVSTILEAFPTFPNYHDQLLEIALRVGLSRGQLDEKKSPYDFLKSIIAAAAGRCIKWEKFITIVEQYLDQRGAQGR
jgi:hypothetical protein